jgi:hypothetical protein
MDIVYRIYSVANGQNFSKAELDKSPVCLIMGQTLSKKDVEEDE